MVRFYQQLLDFERNIADCTKGRHKQKDDHIDVIVDVINGSHANVDWYNYHDNDCSADSMHAANTTTAANKDNHDQHPDTDATSAAAAGAVMTTTPTATSLPTPSDKTASAAIIYALLCSRCCAVYMLHSRPGSYNSSCRDRVSGGTIHLLNPARTSGKAFWERNRAVQCRESLRKACLAFGALGSGGFMRPFKINFHLLALYMAPSIRSPKHDLFELILRSVIAS